MFRKLGNMIRKFFITRKWKRYHVTDSAYLIFKSAKMGYDEKWVKIEDISMGGACLYYHGCKSIISDTGIIDMSKSHNDIAYEPAEIYYRVVNDIRYDGVKRVGIEFTDMSILGKEYLKLFIGRHLTGEC